MKRSTATPVVSLSAAQLTGREASHVSATAEWSCLLHPEAAQALSGMRQAARTEGIDLDAVSGFRDFSRQLSIWNGKYRGERPLFNPAGERLDALQLSSRQRIDAILQWSALPGASRHHWGTDVDLVDPIVVAAGHRPELVSAEYAEGGAFAALARWLDAHAGEFGFYRPYEEDRGGVRPEPWHWSYAPIALDAGRALSVDILEAALAQSGIEGWTEIQIELVDLHQRYVMNVDEPRWWRG